MSMLNKSGRLIAPVVIFTDFTNLSGDCPRHEDAWRKLEEEREELGLNEKYSTYNSFRKAKKTYMNVRFV
jgi:hypothetical protein